MGEWANGRRGELSRSRGRNGRRVVWEQDFGFIIFRRTDK